MGIALPHELQQRRLLGPDWGRWLDRLPEVLGELLDEWGLARQGEQLWHGNCSLVVPVVDEHGTRAALKITFDGDRESVHEALALQHWRGEGAVRLLRADPHRRALLIERLHRRDLHTVPDLQACAIVADSYARLHRPAPPQLAQLASVVRGWLAELEGQPPGIPVPRRFREQALSLGADLTGDPASVGRIIHCDLHYGNVLAAPPALRERGRWMVIDPKPLSGDPHYEVAPMLWNRFGDLAGGVRSGIRRRLEVIVERAGLDADRAVAWVVVRMVLNAHWQVLDAQRGGADLSRAQRDSITRCIAIIKAVQD